MLSPVVLTNSFQVSTRKFVHKLFNLRSPEALKSGHYCFGSFFNSHADYNNYPRVLSNVHHHALRLTAFDHGSFLILYRPIVVTVSFFDQTNYLHY